MEELGREYLASAEKIKERRETLRAQLAQFTKAERSRIFARLRVLADMETEARSIGFRLIHYYERREGEGD